MRKTIYSRQLFRETMKNEIIMRNFPRENERKILSGKFSKAIQTKKEKKHFWVNFREETRQKSSLVIFRKKRRNKNLLGAIFRE